MRDQHRDDLPGEQEIRAVWEEATVAEQRDLLALGIDAIIVRTVAVRIEDRALVLLRGDAPDDLPRA
jgi:hypothetical protein